MSVVHPALSAATPAAAPGKALLEVEALSMRFGGLLAVDGVAFALKER